MKRRLTLTAFVVTSILCLSQQQASAQIITIGDRVWYDVNRNGRQDSGEPGIAGVVVKLFADNNADNIADNTSPKATATTDANGMYTFNNITAGLYFVQFPIPVPTGYTGYTTQSATGVPQDQWSACNVNTGKTGTHNFTATYLFKDAGLLKNIGISGKAFNDVNGLTDNTVNGSAVSLGSTVLYANLYKGTTFVASTVITNGDYSFANLPGNTNYTISISTSAGNASTTPSSVLPSGWVNTGEFTGTTAGNDGTPNGLLSVSLGTASISNANFGIEQLPTPTSITAAAQPNPGGTNSATVPAATFGGTDPDGGTISALRITAFPGGATSITVNNVTYTAANFPTSTGITVPTNASGQPTQTITVDPASEGPSSVTIPFKVTDNAGKESTTTGTATIPFLGIISGNVFNDVDGMTDNMVDGTGINKPSGQQLYAYLLNSAGLVIDAATVTTTGSFTFNKAAANTTYTAVISTTNAAIGSSNPSVALPSNWVNTGEFMGSTAGSDGTPNGLLSVSLGTASISNANFGIEQLPTPTGSTAAAQPNPGGTNSATVPAATFSGTDPDAGTISALRITAFPGGATSITVNNVTYTAANFPTSTGITVPTNTSGQPTQTIKIDPASEGPSSVTIPFKVTDNAGKESTTTGTATIPFLGIISGNVFNDVDGMTDNMVDGTGINKPSGQQLYAYLLNSAGLIIDTATVTATGSFIFNKAAENTTYTAVISTTNAAIGSSNASVALPSNWVNTGEQIGGVTGN
ncbi:hypothetical protein DBR32_13550, partial [Taibaiella sp. KBW10]|uniref:SdrD B-like domain-containing protein n=1 Tax=Taibaiella sp. KBW10 TaxID=2153357 RepID=UPI000FBFD7EA